MILTMRIRGPVKETWLATNQPKFKGCSEEENFQNIEAFAGEDEVLMMDSMAKTFWGVSKRGRDFLLSSNS